MKVPFLSLPNLSVFKGISKGRKGLGFDGNGILVSVDHLGITTPVQTGGLGTAAVANIGTGAGQVPVTGDYNPTSTTSASAPISATRASGTYAFSGALTVGNSATINGVVFTAIANEGTPTGDQFKIGTSYDDAATNLIAAIQAHAGYGTAAFPITVAGDYAVDDGYIVTVTSIYYTTAGNSVGFLKTAANITISAGGTLTGGTEGTTASIIGQAILVGDTPGYYLPYTCQQVLPVIWVADETMPSPILCSATTEQFVASIDNLLTGLTPNAGRKNIFSTLDHATPTYVRSATCWAATVDLTPVSVWNSRNAGTIGLTLITPTKAVGIKHSLLQVNDTVRFVASDNTVVTRTITVVDPFTTDDLCIYTLNSAITTIIPARWAELPTVDLKGLPLIGFNQTQEAIVREFSHYTSGLLVINWRTSNTMSSERLPWFETPVTGDSGYPVCAVFNGRLVLTGCMFGGSDGNNLLGSHYRNLIETKCAEGAFPVITGSYVKAYELDAAPTVVVAAMAAAASHELKRDYGLYQKITFHANAGVRTLTAKITSPEPGDGDRMYVSVVTGAGGGTLKLTTGIAIPSLSATDWAGAGYALAASKTFELLLRYNTTINKWCFLSFTGGFA